LKIEEIQNFKEVEEKIRCFREKQCAFCGGKLNYVSSYGFWGCENYKTIKGKHMSFSGKEPVIKPRVQVPRDVLAYVLKACGLIKQIKYKPLWEFIKGTGRKDLRLEYGFTPTETLYNGYEKAKINSLKQEAEALVYLRGIWDIVIPQQCIEYKLSGSARSICFPDFICSNKAEVRIIDAKLFALDDDQLTLYINLIRHIMQSKGDRRPVTGAYIVYKDDFGPLTPASNYPLIRI